ncbi:MAG: S1C family serine protease [Thermodesulfobacteriota bacterium]
MESVVCVRAQLKTREVQFSGFIINPNGQIICTAHDLEGIQKMYVSLFDGREYGARIIKKDLRRDLILLRINLKLDSFIPLNKGRNLIGMGEQLYTVGCPVNLGGTVHSGFVNGPPRRVEGLPLWQVDLDILPGSSGSPVFDIQGNLVGMVKGRYRGTKSVGFLIPLETMTAFMKER